MTSMSTMYALQPGSDRHPVVDLDERQLMRIARAPCAPAGALLLAGAEFGSFKVRHKRSSRAESEALSHSAQLQGT